MEPSNIYAIQRRQAQHPAANEGKENETTRAKRNLKKSEKQVAKRRTPDKVIYMNSTAAHTEATITRPAGTVVRVNGLRWEIIDHTSEPITQLNPYNRTRETIGYEPAFVARCLVEGYSLRVLINEEISSTCN